MRITRDIPLVTCSRCGKHTEKSLGESTAGYYLTDYGYWSKFARDNETVLCDSCMWADPEYIKIYGPRTF